MSPCSVKNAPAAIPRACCAARALSLIDACCLPHLRYQNRLLPSQLAKLHYQELLETRLLSTSGVTHPIKYASLFDRDDNQRVATTDKSFEVRWVLLRIAVIPTKHTADTG